MKASARLTLEFIAAAILGAFLVWIIKSQSAGVRESDINVPAESKLTDVNNRKESNPLQQTASRTSAEAPISELSNSKPGAESKTLLFGTVTDRAGNPAAVSIIFGSDREEKELWCNAAVPGNYSVSGIRPGEWRAETVGFGYRKLRKVIHIPDGAERVREDFVIDKSIIIPVRIKTPEGQSIAGILYKTAKAFSYLGRACTVVATREQPGKTIPILTEELYDYGIGKLLTQGTNSRAVEKQPADVDGVLELYEDPPCFASFIMGKYVIATKAVTTDMAVLDMIVTNEQIEAALGNIKLRVIDAATGAPPEKIYVSLNTSTGGGQFEKKGGDGIYMIEKVLPGRYTVWVQNSEGILSEKKVVVEPGQSIDLGTIETGKVSLLKGSVRDAAGKPVRCRLSILDISSGALPGSSSPIETAAEPDGSFTFRISRSVYQVSIRDPEWAVAAESIDTSLGEPKNVDFVLQKGTLVILKFVLNPAIPVRFTIKNKDGNAAWSRSSYNTVRDRLRLVEGSYTLQIDDANGPRKWIPFEVAKDTVRLDVSW